MKPTGQENCRTSCLSPAAKKHDRQTLNNTLNSNHMTYVSLMDIMFELYLCRMDLTHKTDRPAPQNMAKCTNCDLIPPRKHTATSDI